MSDSKQPTTPQAGVEVVTRNRVTIPFTAFLKSMWLIAWACLRHPHGYRRVDVANGRYMPQ